MDSVTRESERGFLRPARASRTAGISGKTLISPWNKISFVLAWLPEKKALALLVTGAHPLCMSFQFAILGDIHVAKRDGGVSAEFQRIIDHVAAQSPRFVVLAGDMTCGNEDDGYTIDQVRRWWGGLKEALTPLRGRGIPVLPIAGNHDWYTAVHRQGYTEAWESLAADVRPLVLSGAPPHHYSVRVDGLHLTIAHIIDQNVESEVAEWLRRDLAVAATAVLRLAVGHVPMRSTIARPNRSFERQLGQMLARGKVACYFAGHEHLVWDQPIDIDGFTLRQYIIGTPGASYTFPLHPTLRERYCRGERGYMPWSGHAFALNPSSGKQVHEATFVIIDVDGAEYRVTPFAIDGSGRVVEFLDTAIAKPDFLVAEEHARWLQRALNSLMNARLEVDGDIGPKTKEAVREFQRRYGLAVDGIAGPKTDAKLRDLLASA